MARKAAQQKSAASPEAVAEFDTALSPIKSHGRRSTQRKAPIPAGAYAMTHQEIANVLGITRGGVFMAEKYALRKARLIMEKRGYTAALLVDVLRML